MTIWTIICYFSCCFIFNLFLVIALKIHISTSTYEALTEFPSFVVEDRGEIPIKVSCFTFIVFLDGVLYTLWLPSVEDRAQDVTKNQ